jgi:hypothetical protein
MSSPTAPVPEEKDQQQALAQLRKAGAPREALEKAEKNPSIALVHALWEVDCIDWHG